MHFRIYPSRNTGSVPRASALWLACSLFLIIIVGNQAAGTTRLYGIITGADGRPMKAACVEILVSSSPTPIRVSVADSGGRYAVDIDSAGIWMIRFSGVGHRDQTLALLAEGTDTIHLDLRLSSLRYLPDFSHCALIGSFNRWYPLSALPMRLQADSVYTAEVTSVADTIEYCVTGVADGQFVAGTSADSYRYDPLRGFVSVIAARRGIVHMSFDPRQLLRSEKPPEIAFVGAPSDISRFTGYYSELLQAQDLYISALRDSARSGRFRGAISFDWSARAVGVLRELAGENSKILREELFLEYLTYVNSAKVYDRKMLDSALREITPESIVWSLNPHLLRDILSRSTFTPEEQSRYVDEVVSKNPVAATKAALLFDEAMVARLSGDNMLARHYARILVDRFGATPEATIAKRNGTLSEPLVIGKPIPAFFVASMDDTTKLISNETLKGRYYLLEFWAAKNEKCVAQRKYLTSAYSKYKKKKFTIVSLSADDSRSDVVRFRRGKWPMPWLNAFVGRNPDHPVVRAFEAYDIPTIILVDPQGNLVAMGDDLLSERLGATLRKILGR